MAAAPGASDELEVGVDVLAADPQAFVLDVREPAEYAAGRVPGAVLMPMQSVPRRFGELPGSRVYVVCHLGARSLRAAQFLHSQGVDAVSVVGGTEAWERAGHPLER